MFSRFARQFFRPNFSLWKILCCAAGNRLIYNRNRVATLWQFVVVGCLSAAQDSGEKPSKRKRTESKQKYLMSLESKSPHYLNALKVRWQQLHEIPGLFAYQLSGSRPSRVLPGKHQFYTELNTDRVLKRRQPQTIENLNPKFKPKQFNFNKVDDLEVMLTIDKVKNNSDVQMIINRSPLTKFHTLVCPEVKSNLVQRITPQSLHFCLTFMRSMNDRDIRMGYNSPGALASVNHLHFHLIHLPRELYIDQVELEQLAGGFAYRTSRDMPIQALCLIIEHGDDDDLLRRKIDKMYQLTNWMCQNNIPHNLFITQDRRPGKLGDLQVFIFARDTYCVNKDITAFNVGFCELAGFLPLGDEEKMKNLTETLVIQRISDITGQAMETVYEQFKYIVDGVNGPDIWSQPFVI